MTQSTTKARSVLLGLAYGDAWGADNEFVSYHHLTYKDPRGPELPAKLRVTDDTQMALHVARGINSAYYARDRMTGDLDIPFYIADEFCAWYEDPDNNRAPGNTCLVACSRLYDGYPWPSATVPEGKGCGAVMRVAPVAFLPRELMGRAAAWQAAATHGYPAAIAASVVLTLLLRRAIDGEHLDRGLLDCAIELTERIDPRQFVDWIVEHPSAGTLTAAAELLDDGLIELRGTLKQARDCLDAFVATPWDLDPSDDRYGGQGWDSMTCLATALLCIDLLPDNPVEALRRATVTGGDSDSIAAVAGAVLGALHDDPWPAQWNARLERRYRTWIDREADFLNNLYTNAS